MEDYGTLDGMKVGLVATGELGPFSSTKLEIIWQPHIPGRVDTEFLITFSDPLSDSVSVEKALIFCVFFKIIFFFCGFIHNFIFINPDLHSSHC